jgi:steroid 5-alpha reductase family enzyme
LLNIVELMKNMQQFVQSLTVEQVLELIRKLSLYQQLNLGALSLLITLATISGQKKAALISLVLNLSCFSLHTWPLRSEKYYDATGTSTHFLLALLSLLQQSNLSKSQLINASCSMLWSVRLGTFLFTRIHILQKDARFDEIKKDHLRLLFAFTMQSVWCYWGQLNLLTSNSKMDTKQSVAETSNLEWLGRFLFLFGFVFETLADAQKLAFQTRTNVTGTLPFITQGLWRYSRHPNHFGEICVQTGLALMCSKHFSGLQRVWGWSFPVFNIYLLTRMSGIPMLEAQGLKKWGKLVEYQNYLRDTPVLVPKFL